jgi:SAM-dependent methyltransferase
MKDRLGLFLQRWRTKEVLPFVKGRLLDLGCGNNALVGEYKGQGIGVDVFQWGNVDIVIHDSACLPFSAGEFDTVTVIAALNHIPNREEALKEIHRVLRPGGELIVTMIPPRVSRVWHLLRKPWDADQLERKMKVGEVYGLSDQHLKQMLEQTGFQITGGKRFMLGINRITLAMKPLSAEG